ncbi:MAG: Na+/H+ antiporter subunit G [Pseudomonadota bacterium]|nr:Na+/H+ antiporter subunit G [Pseudomonadota bacterium]
MIATLVDWLTAALLLLGAGFALLGSIGLARLPDIYTRLHGPTKATTLGIGGILLGSILYFSLRQGLSLHEVLVSVFLFITAPVSAHLIARAALQRRCKSLTPPPPKEGVVKVPSPAGRGLGRGDQKS